MSNPPIPRKVLERYRRFRAMAEDENGNRHERRSARKSMEVLEGKYPDMRAHVDRLDIEHDLGLHDIEVEEGEGDPSTLFDSLLGILGLNDSMDAVSEVKRIMGQLREHEDLGRALFGAEDPAIEPPDELLDLLEERLVVLRAERGKMRLRRGDSRRKLIRFDIALPESVFAEHIAEIGRDDGEYVWAIDPEGAVAFVDCLIAALIEHEEDSRDEGRDAGRDVD